MRLSDYHGLFAYVLDELWDFKIIAIPELLFLALGYPFFALYRLALRCWEGLKHDHSQDR